MHPSKRRKLENVSSTLTKPFRSPVKRSVKASDASIIHTRRSQPDLGAASFCQATSSVSHTPLTASPIEPVPNPTGDLETLQTEYKSLSKQLKELRQTLDTVEQAHRIAVTSQEPKINSLVVYWRGVAREVAEELFETYQERVMTEGETEAQSKNTGSHKPPWMDDNEQVLSEERKELLIQQKAEDDQLALKYNLVADAVSEQQQGQVSELCQYPEPTDAQQQNCTMDVMLRQMNIDPSLLGYDPLLQQWTDK